MNILLVDDNTDYLMMLERALFAAGYTVQTAADGMEACEKLGVGSVDLIISDIRMPRCDGLKLRSLTRDMEDHKNTKFLFISAFRDTYGSTITLDPTREFFLDKTTSLDEIIRFVDKLIFGRFARLWTPE